MGIDSTNPYKDYGGSIDKGWQDDTPNVAPERKEDRMVLATSRPQTVEAIRWDGEKETFEKMLDAEIPVKCLGELELMAGKEGAQGWVPVPLGHWIVRSEGDLSNHWPVEHEYFSSKYMY